MKRNFNPDLNPYVSRLEEHKDIILPSLYGVRNDRHLEERRNLINHTRPIIVDLGCGSGNFLRDYALTSRDCEFIGFELRFKRLVKGAIKFKKHNLSNVRLIQARAEEISSWFPEKRVREININFPDPWPKKRHRKHRLITTEFLRTVHSILVEKGFFVFKTDHWEYFSTVVGLVKNMSCFETVEYSEDLHRSVYDQGNIPTEFELLFKNKGYPVYYIKIRSK